MQQLLKKTFSKNSLFLHNGCKLLASLGNAHRPFKRLHEEIQKATATLQEKCPNVKIREEDLYDEVSRS